MRYRQPAPHADPMTPLTIYDTTDSGVQPQPTLSERDAYNEHRFTRPAVTANRRKAPAIDTMI